MQSEVVLCGSVEEKIDIPEGRKDDFRREIMNFIGIFRPDDRVEAFPDRCMPADDLTMPRIAPCGNKNIISNLTSPSTLGFEILSASQ